MFFSLRQNLFYEGRFPGVYSNNPPDCSGLLFSFSKESEQTTGEIVAEF
jgi:hypothetical protein